MIKEGTGRADPQYVLEVCADSVESAIAAWSGGADRVELCSALIIGGLSPGPVLFRQVRQYTDLEIRVLLRPRFGDFCYSKYEHEALREEVEMFREMGADGVVIGSLNPDGTLNMEQMEELAHLAGDMKITMHRAFDVCRDPFEALEQCIGLGIDTILTSGQKASAWEGRSLLAELVKRAAGRIEILAGAGIGPDSIAGLADFTGVRSFHMSGKEVKESRMQFRREGVPMGLPGFDEFEIWQTAEENVRAASQIIRKLMLSERPDSEKQA